MSIVKLLNRAVLQAVAHGDEKVLTELDSHGLLPVPGESANDFAKRLELLANALESLEKDLKKHKSFEVAPGIYACILPHASKQCHRHASRPYH